MGIDNNDILGVFCIGGDRTALICTQRAFLWDAGKLASSCDNYVIGTGLSGNMRIDEMESSAHSALKRDRQAVTGKLATSTPPPILHTSCISLLYDSCFTLSKRFVSDKLSVPLTRGVQLMADQIRLGQPKQKSASQLIGWQSLGFIPWLGALIGELPDQVWSSSICFQEGCSIQALGCQNKPDHNNWSSQKNEAAIIQSFWHAWLWLEMPQAYSSECCHISDCRHRSGVYSCVVIDSRRSFHLQAATLAAWVVMRLLRLFMQLQYWCTLSAYMLCMHVRHLLIRPWNLILARAVVLFRPESLIFSCDRPTCHPNSSKCGKTSCVWWAQLCSSMLSSHRTHGSLVQLTEYTLLGRDMTRLLFYTISGEQKLQGTDC